MAQNLLRAGNELIIFNRSPEKTKRLAEQGARVAASPAEAARGSEALLTMLPDDHALEEVTFGPEGIFSGLRQGATHISSSTISINATRRFTEEHERRGFGFVTATVFGRPQAAEKSELLVIASAINRFWSDTGPCSMQSGGAHSRLELSHGRRTCSSCSATS